MSYRVFLSHSTKDRIWTDWIASNSSAIGLSVYAYEYDPRPGTYIAAKIEGAIRECDAFVVLLTQNSAYSPYVQQEIGFAESAEKRIFPLVDPSVSSDCLGMLGGREYILFNFADPAKGLGVLLASIDQLRVKKEWEKALLWGLGSFIALAILDKQR